MPATAAAFRVNSDELAHNDEQDFSAVLHRMETVAGIAAMQSASVPVDLEGGMIRPSIVTADKSGEDADGGETSGDR
jgi:hypothetical protein